MSGVLKKTVSTCTVLSLSMSGAFGLATSARAFGIFFGEDLNHSATQPLTDYQNAQQAETEFLSHLVGVGTETFESFPLGTADPLSLDFGEAGTATLKGNGVINSVTEGTTNGYGRYGISKTNYWETNAAGNNFVVEFSQAVAAFGFYGVDLGDFGGELMLNLTLANGGQKSIAVPNTVGSYGNTDGSVLYFGAIADGADELFTSLSFNMTAPGTGMFADIFAFDNMTVGSLSQVKQDASDDLVADAPSQSNPSPQEVPEPLSTIALFLVGAVGTRTMRRKAD
ncbi:PEP-CTERM sorting domain-containing protein [Baaleninema simplex]|uniref:PEP-CTERM sorting domain-containing protein n=1 Tax=Baaleninema simplex TaxID=2862350 RepID=UPI00055920EB|nr:PEP-CTERM sorting domain-containing protein [Baaleninema simplex]